MPERVACFLPFQNLDIGDLKKLQHKDVRLHMQAETKSFSFYLSFSAVNGGKQKGSFKDPFCLELFKIAYKCFL